MIRYIILSQDGVSTFGSEKGWGDGVGVGIRTDREKNILNMGWRRSVMGKSQRNHNGCQRC